MIELQSHDDIIVPFNRISDAGWEQTTRLILEKYAELDEQEMAPPVSDATLREVEKRLGSFPDALALFYKTFGVADIGEILLPPEEMKPLERFWNEGQGPQSYMSDSERSVLPDLIVFGDYLGNGNMFCFHRNTHAVWYFDHDTPPFLTRLFDCVDDYLKACLVRLQGNFFSNPDKGDDIAIDTLFSLFGKNVIKKWMY